MNRIFKYELEFDYQQTIETKEFAELLAVQLQGTTLYLWAMIDESLPDQKRRIIILNTGEPIKKTPKKYLGTVQDGSIVLHIFDDGAI